MFHRSPEVWKKEAIVLPEEEAELAVLYEKPRRRMALPHFDDPRQKRYFYNILRFLALLLVLTLVARGTAGATLPVVETVRPQNGDLVQSVEASGAVKAAGELALYAPKALLVEKVLVRSGQSVKEGDGLVQFDLPTLEEQLERERAALGEMEAKWQGLQHGQAVDGTALTNAQNSYAWAQQDAAAARSQGEAALAAAQQVLAAANAAAAAAASALEAVPPDASPEARAAAEAALAEANAKVQEATEALQTTGTEAAENQTSTARAEESARQSLAAAQAENAAARTAATDTASQNQAAAQTLALDMEKSKERIEELNILVAGGGIWPAEKGGVVQKSPAAGETVGETPLLTLSDESGGFVAEVELPGKEAEKLQLGAACELVPESSSLFAPSVRPGTLEAFSAPGENGQVMATIRLEEGDWKAGEGLRAKFSLQENSYSLILPLGALHAGSSGYYLLAVEETDTVLGKEEQLVQIPVTLLAQDDTSVAVDGPLGPETRVVSGSNKALSAGDRVRVNTP